ncbi:carbon-nitrogen hydrolase family protein [Helicobacter muridarum]|uniref:Carbon-nitrogen hydrolase family protein n=1 Tax=Helicobacter muridarum TaxID=216 RepID=A0A099U0C7_9HELI|nr:carbon-nitrogen hydrolase family protein [Helicobacter muridarum]TLE00863.1 carbon-nitrogen hydrolase family protein [Helicobacter muridarum]STQ86635.1 putative nitrilase/cyanide hydratase [Helicobacter muridarum]
MIFRTFYSIQLQTKGIWQENLDRLESRILKCVDNSFILASEMFLTGFAYQQMDKANDFSNLATKKLKELSTNKTIAITMMQKSGEQYINLCKVFHKGKIIHTQPKVKLFALGEEHLYFKPGKIEDIKIFQIDNIPCAVLNCFEIRFIELWQRVRGAKVVFVPAAWGKTRKVHFQTLTRALAIANQCFVIASSCAGEEYAKGSCIITPYGTVYKNDSKDIISASINLSEADKMRSHIDTGVSNAAT